MGIYRNTACIAAATLLAIATTSASAEQKTVTSSSTSQMSGLKLSKDKPIQIEADHLEIHDQDKQALFDGNVQVVQGTMTLNSNHMIVFYNGKGSDVSSGQGDIRRIEVSGNVSAFSGTQSAKGDQGSYEMSTQLLTLTGKQVVLVDGTNVFTGCKLTVQMQTGLAKLDNCGTRVRISIDPKSDKSNNKTN